MRLSRRRRPCRPRRRLFQLPPESSRFAGLLPDSEVILVIDIAEIPEKRAFRGVCPHPVRQLPIRLLLIFSGHPIARRSRSTRWYSAERQKSDHRRQDCSAYCSHFNLISTTKFARPAPAYRGVCDNRHPAPRHLRTTPAPPPCRRPVRARRTPAPCGWIRRQCATQTGRQAQAGWNIRHVEA